MDLLFSRYASPFLLLDTVIETSSLCSFIDNQYNQVEENKQWEFFLHKVFDKSWKDFLDEVSISNNETSNINLSDVIRKSRLSMAQFKPERS